MSEREHDDGRCCEGGYLGTQHECRKQNTDQPWTKDDHEFLEKVTSEYAKRTQPCPHCNGDSVNGGCCPKCVADQPEKSAYDALNEANEFHKAAIRGYQAERDQLRAEVERLKGVRRTIDLLEHENAKLRDTLEEIILQSNPWSQATKIAQAALGIADKE